MLRNTACSLPTSLISFSIDIANAQTRPDVHNCEKNSRLSFNSIAELKLNKQQTPRFILHQLRVWPTSFPIEFRRHAALKTRLVEYLEWQITLRLLSLTNIYPRGSPKPKVIRVTISSTAACHIYIIVFGRFRKVRLIKFATHRVPTTRCLYTWRSRYWNLEQEQTFINNCNRRQTRLINMRVGFRWNWNTTLAYCADEMLSWICCIFGKQESY